MKTYNITNINESLSKKLSRKEKDLLLSALNDLSKAEKFILNDKTILGCRHKTIYGDSFINKNGEAIGVYNKHIGSDICYLFNAIRSLKNILEPIKSPEETF